jgi:Ca2+-binding RTX toxin-like protein
VVPTEGDDHLQGTTEGDGIDGLGGDDLILGLGGNDSLMGSAGDDTLDGGAGDDLLNGGGGNDTASYASAGSGVTVRLKAGAQPTGGDGIDSLAGIENLTGSGFKDHLTGSAKANALDGGAGNDKLSGGGGDDLLDGGAGKDQLAGGAGADRFAFADGQANNDKIADLSDQDLIDLHLIDADAGQPGDQAFTLVGAFGHHAGEAVLSYQAAKDLTLLQLDVDGDAKADVTLRLAGDHAEFDSFVL